MFSAAAAKMSVEASDVQTDEDCEELVEDGFSFSADILEKQRTRRKRSSGKPSSPRSPYLSSLNVNPRRVAVAAWRLPRASLGDTRGDTPGDTGSARLTSLSNGHDLSQMLRSECDVTPELLRQTLTARKHKQLHCASNGTTSSSGDYREKEDMYDEIIRLKKSLQAQKSDNQKMKAKLRRLEGDNAKREKQLEELLDPTKGSDYTRSLVDKKKEGSVVLNGLKQRILKLEQQCREKENALSNLQSELRTTNLEELKITVETYFEEIQRLRMLLEAAEKSSRAESKCSQRQQKALSSTVLRLSDNLKQLQQENTTLREELNTESPSGGVKGYREWSKQRLLRRLFEVEKRLEDSRKHAHRAKSSGRLDQEVQTTPTEILDVAQGFAMATEAVVSVGTSTEEGEEVAALRGSLSQLETEKAELQETLSSKDDEVRQLRTENEELKKEAVRWKDEQTNERDKERQQHEQELEELKMRIQSLEEDRSKLAQAEQSSLSPTTHENLEDTHGGAGLEEGGEGDTGGKEKEKEREEAQQKSENGRQKEREKAACIIQTNWREYRNRDIVLLQSALRGHLLRELQLKDLQEKAVEATNCSNVAPPVEGEMDVVALTMIQSAFRGHLARCSLAIESSGFSVPSPLSLPTLVPRRARSTHTPSRTGSASLHNSGEKQGEEEDLWSVSSTHASSVTPTTAQTELQFPAESGGSTAVDSDDSDDIIVSPSRPPRRREVLIL
ncbi:IQ domain-containing protein E isoform X1 [Scomber scombrus]|uniref:IQ domain-containing protein E isoform X1 n=1 Tax=Scomber scombrus TaxID=13677 RepID=UPI002DD950FE|nr:IQ domain-containing protein E isoform X1 [Scomber scombrus]